MIELGNRGNSFISFNPFIQATGGTITFDGTRKIHTFTSSGTFEITSNPEDKLLDLLIVAGGGAGNNVSTGGGGGGAGGFKFFNGKLLSPASYTVTIGDGGDATTSTNGDNSSFDTDIATGGGNGGGDADGAQHGQAGGSGGGGGADSAMEDPGLGTTNEGFDGGMGLDNPTDLTGGGGGASEDGAQGGEDEPGGNGGDGFTEGSSDVYDWVLNDGTMVTFDIDGTGNSYAGGGGGAMALEQSAPGQGGLGGGGNGGGIGDIDPNPGTPNTGGGGGGRNNITAVTSIGGSGIVIVSYQLA